MTSSVSSSASDWPPKMTNPIAWFVPDPTPRETISGIMPATNANVVIRIGRSRSRLACTIASCVRQARLLELVGVVDLQNRVLLHDAEQHEQAERREDVQRLPEDDDRQQREGQRQRQRQQNRDRMQPRFELCRENEIHEDQRQHEREHEVLRRAAELLRPAGERRRDIPDRAFRLWNSASMAFCTSACDALGSRFANTVTCRWRASRLMSDGAEPGEKSATLSSDTAPRRVDGTVRPATACSVVRSACARAQMHLVLLAAFVVRRHLIAADQQAQRLGRVSDLHAHVGRLRPIDLHRQLRLADVHRGIDVHDAGQLLHAR